MNSLVRKVTLIALICTNLTHCAKDQKIVDASMPSTTTTTSVATVPTATVSTREVTDQVEASAQLDARQLDPHESRPRSKAQGYSDQGRSYSNSRNRGSSGPQKNRYEDHAVEYIRDPDDEFYRNSEETPYRRQRPRQQRPRHPTEYIDSFEGPDEATPTRHQEHRDSSYEEHPSKGRVQYSAGRDGYPDYSKEDSYESREVRDSKGHQQQQHLLRGHEGPRKKQQATYDPLDVPDGDVSSRYGPGMTKVHPPPAYYPRPKQKPRRYPPENHKETGYNSVRPREGGYFPTIPREAGYAPDEHKEPDYLQTPPKKAPSYLQQAGYSPPHHPQHHQGGPNSDYPGPRQHKQGPAHPPRQQEPRHGGGNSRETGFLIKQHEDILQILQKKSERSPDGGKVSIHIKHLGYSTLPGAESVKGRQGFLLLPILSDNVQQVKQYLGGSHQKPEFDDDREQGHRQKIPEQPVAIPHDYPPAYDHPRPPAKGFPPPQYGNFRPIVKHSIYETPEFDDHRVHHVQDYSEEVSQEGNPLSVPKTFPHPYGERHELKTLRPSHLSYSGPHGVIPSFTGAVRYEPASVYENKAPRYESPYDVTRAFRNLPSKARGYQPSLYSSLHRFADFPKPGEYGPLGHHQRPKKKNSETSLLYSTQYRNVANRLAAEYGQPNMDSEGKRQAYIEHRTPERDLVDYRAAYPSEARPYMKALEDLGLQHYESVLGQPKDSRTAVGALYYDLAPHSANQNAAQVSVDGPGSKEESPNIEIFV